MAANVEVATLPAKGVWAGRSVSWLPAGFLLVDGVPKLFKPAPVIEGTVKLGYSESVIIPLGIVLIACTVLYLIPRTAVLGAFLLTAYLGGAVATHVRVNESWFNVFFAVTFAFASKVFSAYLCGSPRLCGNDSRKAYKPQSRRGIAEIRRENIKRGAHVLPPSMLLM